MKIGFMVSSVYYQQNRQMCTRVNRAIEQAGHELCLKGDDMLVSETVGDKKALDTEDWQLLCKRELAVARNCDVAIVDVTNKSTFGIGYFAATALQAGKPTLFLMHKDSLQGSVISGLQHDLLSRAVYNDTNVEKIITNYLKTLKAGI